MKERDTLTIKAFLYQAQCSEIKMGKCTGCDRTNYQEITGCDRSNNHNQTGINH